MATKFVPIVAEELDEEQLLNGLVLAVKDEVKFSDNQFRLTYKTWKNQPKFKQEFSQKPNLIEGSTTTSGEGSKKHPYPFVTKGTSVRFATMTPDFQAKTTRRVISSRSGRGGVAFVDKRKPRPGIEGREFEEEIAKREEPKFQRRAQKRYDEAAKRSDHAI